MPSYKVAALGTPNPVEQQRIASEAEIERQRELAQSFANRAANTQKIANPLQGINYAAQNILGAVFDKRADKQEAARRDAMAQALTGALGDTSAYGIPEDSLRQIMAIDPSFGAQLLSKKLENKMKAPEYGFEEVDGALLRTNPDGSVTPVYGGGASGAQPPLFKGTSVEAQALNGLVESGELTREQAMQLGAGKTITGPQGQIIFMTPQGVFSRPAAPEAPAAAEQPAAVPPVDPSAANPGLIPLTGNKTEGTEGQMSAGLYADRMQTANELITQLEEAGTSLQDKALSQVPGVGNYLISEEYQKLDQARRDFVNAVLRRESGAVISDEEFDNANKQYFPQPGDTPETIAQKRQNRQVAIAGISRAAGPNYKAPALPPTPVQSGKPVTEMTIEELEAIINGR
jgi:hypothetical protein